MLMTVLLTCVLAAGEVYTPPRGWEIVQVSAQGTYQPCTKMADGHLRCLSVPWGPTNAHTTVRLRQRHNHGPFDVESVPQTCTAEAEGGQAR